MDGDPPEFLRPREYVPEGALVRMWRFALRNRHVTIPLAVPVAMLAAGQVLSHQDFSPVTEDVVAAAASVTMWFAAEKKWDTGPRWKGWRWTSEVAYARATVIAASGWLLLAARYGPLTPALEWLLGALALAWGIPYWQHKRPRDKRARRRHAAEVAGWDRWWQSHAPAWGLAVQHVPVSEDGPVPVIHASGSYIVDLTEHAGMTSLLIQLWKGRQTVADIKRVLPLVESALGGYVAHGMTRCEVNKADPSQVWLHLKREDPLREEIPWTPAMAPADIREASALGVRESGKWLKRCLLASFFILGRSRWGKSNEQSVMLATITGCRNSRAWLIDMKGGRATRPWLPAVDWVATTTGEADLMMACGIAEIKARGTYAYSGTEQLDPTPDVPALFLDIDETYEVTSEMSGSPGAARRAGWLATIASQGQGLAVYTIVLTQYGALDESVGTEQTRLNLNVRMCFQTERREHGTFALGDDANNTVDTTKLAQKGAFYYRADSETVPEQIRGPLIEHDQVREIAVRNAERTGLHERPLLLYCGNQPCPLMPGKTWQQVYDERWSRLPAAFHADAPPGVTVTPSPAEAGQPSSKINLGETDDEIDARIAAMNAEIDELPVTVTDIARARELRAARGAPPLDVAGGFESAKRQFAVLLQGASEHRPASPAQLRKASGTSESWVYLTLGRLADSGQVVKAGRGEYYPAEGANILAALGVIEAEGNRLAKAAREMVGADQP